MAHFHGHDIEMACIRYSGDGDMWNLVLVPIKKHVIFNMGAVLDDVNNMLMSRGMVLNAPITYVHGVEHSSNECFQLQMPVDIKLSTILVDHYEGIFIDGDLEIGINIDSDYHKSPDVGSRVKLCDIMAA